MQSRRLLYRMSIVYLKNIHTLMRFQIPTCILDKGPFIYYLSTGLGGWVQKLAIFCLQTVHRVYTECTNSTQSWCVGECGR